MLIQFVHNDAERLLLSQVEKNTTGLRGALHFQCSKTGLQPQEEDILPVVKPVLEDRNAAVYFMEDDDLVITWSGTQKSVVDTLCERLYQRFHLSTDKSLHQYYDFGAQGEELRLLCKQKLAASSAESKSVPVVVSTEGAVLPIPTPKQLALFRAAASQRSQRKPAEMLVVEDQAFSRKLLTGLLTAHHYTTYEADNAMAAFQLYLEHAPDMVFLDIELPQITGHAFAAAVHAIDPHAAIVMVTGNNYAEDVVQARKNGACGFIAKPYSKQKIIGSIEQTLGHRVNK